MFRLVCAIILFFIVICPQSVFAQEQRSEPSAAFKSTPYPLPRFVSLKSDEVFARTGPGKKYPIKWVFNTKGLPVEVILEYEVWRKIRDSAGDEGWVHQSLLSGKRTGMLQTKKALVEIKEDPKEGSKVTAKAEPNTIVLVEKCLKEYCHIARMGYEGWLEKYHIWGVYADEVFD